MITEWIGRASGRRSVELREGEARQDVVAQYAEVRCVPAEPSDGHERGAGQSPTLAALLDDGHLRVGRRISVDVHHVVHGNSAKAQHVPRRVHGTVTGAPGPGPPTTHTSCPYGRLPACAAHASTHIYDPPAASDPSGL
jgi:hypothetical protein